MGPSGHFGSSSCTEYLRFYWCLASSDLQSPISSHFGCSKRLRPTKLQITISIWTFCANKWAPRWAPLATLGTQVAQNTSYSTGVLRLLTCSRLSQATLVDPSASGQRNCKSPVASGRFVVRNGLQDGPIWPLWELKLHNIPQMLLVFCVF